MTLAMAIELEPAGIRVNAVSPRYTKTNLNNRGTETVQEGAAEAVRVALLGPDGPTGTFTHAKCRVYRTLVAQEKWPNFKMEPA